MTLRLTPAAYALVRAESEREGVTLAVFIREAAIAYAAHRRGQRGDAPWPGNEETPRG